MTRETYRDLKKAVETFRMELNFAGRRTTVAEEGGALLGFIQTVDEMEGRIDEFKPGRRKRAVTS